MRWSQEKITEGTEPTFDAPLYMSRSSFIFRYIPALSSSNGVFEDFSDHLDLSPTLVRLAIKDIDLSSFKYQGRDLSGQLQQRRVESKNATYIYSQNDHMWSCRNSSRPEITGVFNMEQKTTTIYEDSLDENNYPRPSILENHKLTSLYEKKIKESHAQALEAYKALKEIKSQEKDIPLDPKLEEQLRALGYVE